MLGVERYKVALAPYDEDWANQFQITREELITVFSDNLVEIYHVGSTAIKGTAAKPIIDVAAVVRHIQESDIVKMETVGYDYCGEQSPRRYLFVKRRDGNISTHHIHCYLENNKDLSSTVLFCRYLNEYTEYTRQYNDLKMKLLLKYPNDRMAYTNGKAEFINMVINLAKNKYRTESGDFDET